MGFVEYVNWVTAGFVELRLDACAVRAQLVNLKSWIKPMPRQPAPDAFFQNAPDPLRQLAGSLAPQPEPFLCRCTHA